MDSDDFLKLSQPERNKEFLKLLDHMDPDMRLAFDELIFWLGERPKGAESLGQEQIEHMLEEIRLENIRRRLGGKVGEILPFKKSESKE